MRPLTMVFACAFLLALGLPAAAADSKVKAATKEVESGAKKVGQGVEETAKGIGKTVVEGAKSTGETLKETGEKAGKAVEQDRKSTRLNSSHLVISYAVFCLKKKKNIMSHISQV